MQKLNLEPETRCDFLVDEQRKKVWQTELDILEEIIKICKKYDIKYSVCGGTLLGVVRHKGFIPWDDDIDLVMKRSEYNRFLEIASKELQEPYFLQYSKTESNYARGHAQIRNSNTTAIIHDDINNKFNKGIFVDIFPLDNVPDDEKERKSFIRNIRNRKRMLEMIKYKNSKNFLKKAVKFIISKFYWSIFNYNEKIEEMDKIACKYNDISTKQCGAIVFRPDEFKYDNKWFENTIEMNFEYLKVSCTSDYDLLLTRQYGDYMKIPENKNGSLHGNVFFDTEKSYKEYENQVEEIVKKLD